VLEVAALVDIKDLLSNVLSKSEHEAGEFELSLISVPRVHTLWFLLNKTRSAQLAGGIWSNLLSAKTSGHSCPNPSFLPDSSFLLTLSTWASVLPYRMLRSK
jgi:hypothetical protein